MRLLSPLEIAQGLKALNGWTETPQGIQKRYEMDHFLSAMNLVNRAADLAEQAQHHPDIFISYNKVTFTLTTHDAGGITQKDLDLAARIEAIAP
jgi:4a-hydroxytetrahydrobiopterin dehydratase